MPGTMWGFGNLQNRHWPLPSWSLHSSGRDRQGHYIVSGGDKCSEKNNKGRHENKEF